MDPVIGLSYGDGDGHRSDEETVGRYGTRDIIR